MSGTESRPLGIDGAVAFSAPVHRDTRGLFTSPFREDRFAAAVGRPLFAVRDVSHNRSASGVLRGVHYTATPPGRAKYVYCPHGRVRDFLVDLRVGSPTFGRAVTAELGADGRDAVYVPPGVGHAFLALEDDSIIVYLMSAGYVPENELAVSPWDPALGLGLPAGSAVAQSDRDRAAPTLAQALDRGLLPHHADCIDAEAALWR